MREGVLDFVEPDKKGEYHQERFEISDGDEEVLKKEIATVVKDIATLEFWDKRCEAHEKGECTFCALRDAMRG